MRHYPKIPHIESVQLPEDTERVYVQEKIDGACGGFRLNYEKTDLEFMSHHRDINDENPGMFATGMNYVRRSVELQKVHPSYIYYGEYGIKHTIDYESLPLFIGFDVYDVVAERYLDAVAAEEAFKSIGLPFVPTITICSQADISSISPQQQSKFRNGEAEGIVIKSYAPSADVFAKAVTQEFKEKNRMVFGGSKRQATDASEMFVAMYCTEPRILKKIYAHTDEGEELHMRLMMDLPQEVYYDICEECWQDFMGSNWVMDVKKIRKLVSLRCVETLKLHIARSQHANQ